MSQGPVDQFGASVDIRIKKVKQPVESVTLHYAHGYITFTPVQRVRLLGQDDQFSFEHGTDRPAGRSAAVVYGRLSSASLEGFVNGLRALLDYDA